MNVSQHNHRAIQKGPACSFCLLATCWVALCALGFSQAVPPSADLSNTAETVVSSSEAPTPDASAPDVSESQNTSSQNATQSAVKVAEVPAAIISQPEPEPVSKRLFGVIPNYKADQVSDSYKPLTAAEKFKIAREDSFDWPNYFLLAGYAVQAQVAAGGFHNNGGMEGFGEYYARGFADQVIGSYVTEAILPALLHEDPRYFRLGTGHFAHRISYAVSRTFVTRGDNGKTRFFASEVIGNAAVAAIGSTYYPNSGTFGEISEHYGLQLGNDAVSNILTEFWPDIRLRLRFVRQRLVTSLFHH